MAMSEKYFTCSKCGKKPPEKTSFTYSESVLCDDCGPPKPNIWEVVFRPAGTVWRVRGITVCVEAESHEDAKQKVYDEIPDLNTARWTCCVKGMPF